MPETTAPTPPRHLDYLDSARGIAAMMVVIYHYIGWKYEHLTVIKAASILFNGADAVSFFFVLSGFVLSYKYIVLDQPLDIRKFYITRFFRLWPAFFLIVLLNALNSIRNEFSLHNLMNIFIFNKTQFWEEAILFRSHPSYYIPGWTLTIELSLSFLVPFWVFLAKKNVQLIYWLILANLLAAAELFNIHFLLGIILSCLIIRISDRSFKDTKWHRYRYYILFVAAVLFSIRHITRISPIGPTYTYIADYLRINYFFYTGIASFIFIAAILNSPKAQKILRHRFLLFLGKISYGIYLCHWVLVTDIFIYWDNITPHFPNTKVAFIVVLCIYSLTTILLATILHYAVELPFISLGKRLANKFKPSLVIK